MGSLASTSELTVYYKNFIAFKLVKLNELVKETEIGQWFYNSTGLGAGI